MQLPADGLGKQQSMGPMHAHGWPVQSFRLPASGSQLQASPTMAVGSHLENELMTGTSLTHSLSLHLLSVFVTLSINKFFFKFWENVYYEKSHGFQDFFPFCTKINLHFDSILEAPGEPGLVPGGQGSWGHELSPQVVKQHWRRRGWRWEWEREEWGLSLFYISINIHKDKAFF